MVDNYVLVQELDSTGSLCRRLNIYSHFITKVQACVVNG